jgi:hypothetical protein
MPNRKAKDRKRVKRKINASLSTNGRTRNQIERNKRKKARKQRDL